MSEMTQTQAHEMAAVSRSLSVEARVERCDYAPTNPDGSYTGEVKTRYTVVLVHRDAKGGNTVVRELREPCDVGAVVADMIREIRDRGRATRARIRAERENNRS